MPTLVLCVGISASGKSTFAKELVDTQGFVEVNRDNARFTLFCEGVQDWGRYKFSKAKEEEVTAYCLYSFQEAVDLGKDVVVSDTNLKQKYHDDWKHLALNFGYEFEVKYFPIALEEAWKRDERRTNSVGRDVIARQWKDWLEITNHQKYVPNDNLPRCVVVDVDGTLAEMYNRGPFDWAKVGQDKVRLHVIELLEAYIHRYPSVSIVVVSGRDGSCEQETRKWLLENGVFFDELYMRNPGDSRKDSIVKDEILTCNIAPKYNILFWIDDRPQVVRMLKDKGVNVVDVSKDYVEF